MSEAAKQIALMPEDFNCFRCRQSPELPIGSERVFDICPLVRAAIGGELSRQTPSAIGRVVSGIYASSDRLAKGKAAVTAVETCRLSRRFLPMEGGGL